MPQPYNIANISSLAQFMPDIVNSFAQQKASGYPNSRTAHVPEINFYNDVNRDFLINSINKHYSQNNALQIGPRYYQRDPNFVGPELYNQMTNGQDFASYISNPNNGYKIANEEEDEYDAGEDWKNAEIERRNAIQQNFTPLETPNYLQQAQGAISGLKNVSQLAKAGKAASTAKTGLGAKIASANANPKVGKAAAGVGAAAAVSGMAADIGDAYMNKNYKDNQGAYVGTAFGKNQFIDDINNINTTVYSTNFNDAMQQYKGINKQLDAQKTTRLSNKQRWGMVGVGAGKGAATGATVGSLAGPIGTIVGAAAGTVIGGAAGALKGHFANKKIGESNDAITQKKTTANNYLNYTFNDIRKDNALRNKQSAYNMYAYNNAYGGNLYANGGALQDPYGINYFGEGHSHENNRFGGVPVSIAEDGKPNLVEEGEVLYDDYVYSKRIKLPDSMRRQLNLKDDVKTFADAAKAIQERGKERPNDPVMEHTIKAQMQKLKSKQEEVKEKKEQREQEKMLAQMSEQERQMLEQQQMEQQANAYEQQMAAEQQAQIAQQVPQEGMPQEQMDMQEQQPAMPYAEGGKLKGGTDDINSHKFAGEDRWKDYDWNDFDFSKIFNDDTYKYKNLRNTAFDFDPDLADEETKNAYNLVFNNGEYTEDYNNLISSLKNMSDENKAKFIEGYKQLWKKNHGSDFTGDFNEAMKMLQDKKWGNAHAAMSKILKEKPIEEPVKEPQSVNIQQEELDRPIYDWRYRPNWIPGAIDLGMLAQSFAPADYSRARSIENTPIREVQYNPNGQYIKPYIIDPRQQYNLNYANAQATNRAIQNNAGGNGANAVAAMLANNAAANQAAAQIGFQADAANADSINKAIAFNNAVDAQNAQGFLQASEANQRIADEMRGEFNYYGKMLRENIDKQRGQAISNSLGAVADDFNNYYNDRYNRGMIAGLAESGYFGEMPENSLLRKNIGFDVVGRESVDGRNYIEDENGIHYLTPNGVDYNIDGMNNVYLKNINGKYYKTNR